MHPRRGRRADDRGRRRGRRRDHPARASPPSGTCARSRCPRSSAGCAKAGKTRADFEISGPLFVVTGTTDEELEQARQGTKQQIAFYGSTPAYRGVLELHGWGDLQDELNRLSKQGEWVEMGELITTTCSRRSPSSPSPRTSRRRCSRATATSSTALSFYAPYRSDPDRWKGVLAGFKE